MRELNARSKLTPAAPGVLMPAQSFAGVFAGCQSSPSAGWVTVSVFGLSLAALTIVSRPLK
jgi:hypothetical protein